MSLEGMVTVIFASLHLHAGVAVICNRSQSYRVRCLLITKLMPCFMEADDQWSNEWERRHAS